MTTSSDRTKPRRHPVQATDLTSPQSVLDRPIRPSTGTAAPRPSEAKRPLRLLGWSAALVIVGAIALNGGEEVDPIETSTPTPAPVMTTPGTTTLNGYWNPYTLEWIAFQTTATTPTTDGYWNPYTLEWIPFQG